MATTQPIEFPSLSDSRLPSGELDKQILRQLKHVWDQHSVTWDDKTKQEFIDHIVNGDTRVTKTNQTQPSGHRLWKADHMTFASWAGPVSKMPARPRGTNGGKAPSSKGNLGSHGKSHEPKSPQSIEAMEICEEESNDDDSRGDGTYEDGNNDGDEQDETNVSYLEDNLEILLTNTTQGNYPKRPTPPELHHLLRAPIYAIEPSGPSMAPTVDSQARPRTLEWQAKLHELKEYRRGLNQNRLVLNCAALTGDQASLQPNPTAVSFTQESNDQNAFQSSVTSSQQLARSQEPSLRSSASALSPERRANDQIFSGDPRDRILICEHSTQSDHVRAKFGLVDRRSGESAASTQRLPRSPELRGNPPTMARQGSLVSSSSSNGKEQPHNKGSLPFRLITRETLESPGNVFTQQPSSIRQLPHDDPDEPSWFRQFRTEYYFDQKETRERIEHQIKSDLTGIVFQAVEDLIQPLSNSIIQCVDALAKHNANTAGVTEQIDQATSAAQDLRDMKQILNNIVDTSRVQLELSQREGATIQGLLPAITEHRKDIDNLFQRTTSIEERTSDVEEYLELQLTDKGGDSARNAPRGN
ncbi:hypothetical protein FPRO03_08434 [Fusarium proliferatum]|nr:hypothetical protein FPRO03_08434 [Fusarium proliferatum]